MFNHKQYNNLIKQKVQFAGFGCFGKTSSMDITTNLDAFHCFPLANQTRIHVDKKNKKIYPLYKLNTLLLKKRYNYWKKIYLNVCKKCKYYGHTPKDCPGPCIAFLVNTER